MGRMWNTLLLYKWKPIFAWLPTEALIRERQDAYYAALGQADISADATPFVEFLLSVIYGCRRPAADKRVSAGKIALLCRAQPNGNRSINQGLGEIFPNKQREISGDGNLPVRQVCIAEAVLDFAGKLIAFDIACFPSAVLALV